MECNEEINTLAFALGSSRTSPSSSALHWETAHSGESAHWRAFSSLSPFFRGAARARCSPLLAAAAAAVAVAAVAVVAYSSYSLLLLPAEHLRQS